MRLYFILVDALIFVLVDERLFWYFSRVQVLGYVLVAVLEHHFSPVKPP